jgi:hypothetical protein
MPGSNNPGRSNVPGALDVENNRVQGGSYGNRGSAGIRKDVEGLAGMNQGSQGRQRSGREGGGQADRVGTGGRGDSKLWEQERRLELDSQRVPFVLPSQAPQR